MKLYLIRHCESEDDILGCYGGIADFDLTKKGEQTAKEQANNIMKLEIEKIFSSPYKRAKKVANIFNEKIGCGVEVINDLREINTYGVLSGVNKEKAKEIFEQLFKKEEYKEFGYYNGKSFEGGEGVEEFDKRIKKSLEEIVIKDYQVVAIITHGGVFRSVYKNILKQKEKILEIDDLATIEIEYKENKYRVINKNGIKYS